MPAADTARLIASLELDDRKFRAGATRAMGSINRIDRRLGAFSGAVNRNLGRLVDTAVTRGTQLLVDGIKGGIDSLAELEGATTSVDAALKAVGKTGQVTSGQIATWANEVEANVQAAFDDKDIVRGAGALIRYGHIATSNLKPALQVITDMAARTGSVDSAARALGKALADPAKAAGALKKAGVTLNDAQVKQLKTLTSLDKKEQAHYARLRKQDKAAAERYKTTVLNNKAIKAQTYLIDQVGKQTTGAAAGMNGEFVDMQKTLADTVEDAQKVLAKAAMPVLQKLGTKLTEALNNRETMKAIEGIGKGAAAFLDEAISFAEKIPWDSIKSALQIGGEGAKTILNAFKEMPDWVKTAVITGWGLNAITKGALGGIVGEIGKVAIRGVFEKLGLMTVQAGVVQVNGPTAPGTTPPAPGAPGTGGSSSSSGSSSEGGGGSAKGGTAGAGILITDMHQFNKDIADRLSESGTKFGQSAADAFNKQAAKDTPWDALLRALGQSTSPLIGKNNGAIDNRNPGEIIAANTKITDAQGETTGAVRDVKAEQARAIDEMRHSVASNESTTRSGLSSVTSATNNSASRITGAIASNRPITNVDVDVNVTSTGVQKSVVTSNRYGPSEPAYSGPSGKYDKP